MDPDDRRAAIAVVAIIVISFIIAILVWFAVTVFGKHTADFRGSADQTEQVRADGSYRIAAYNRFFDLCAGIQGKEGVIDALKTELAQGPAPDRASQVRSTITAVTGSRFSDIAIYNGDAAKSGTLAQFKTSELPFSIDPNQEHTTCVIR